MKPILFDKTATQFNTNGIGRLDCTKCLVTEERNGQYELEMHIPRGSQYADQIEANSIIVVRPSDEDTLQAFIVYQINDYLTGDLEVFAYHISYRLAFIPTMPFSVTASSNACTNTLAGLVSHAVYTCPFTFHTDVRTIASYQQNVPASIKTMLIGTEGSVVDQFGGEYKWDNFDVYLYNHRGVQTPSVTLRYGKDIIDLSQEKNIANTITGLVPFWVDSEGKNLVTLSQVVESEYADRYPFKRTVPIDFSADFENKPTQAQLEAHARAFINKAGIGLPDISIKLSFVDLAKTLEYKDLLAFQSIKLCDIVGVSLESLGIEAQAEVVKTVYDVLNEKYKSIEVGTVRTSIAKTINDTDASITSLADTTRTNFAKSSNETDTKIENAVDAIYDDLDGYATLQELQEALDDATGWLTAGDSVVRALKDSDGNWTDILFCSRTATEYSGNVMRLNSSGIGFSSRGWHPDRFTQAWTLNGRLVIGGTDVPSITVYDNNDNVIFQADATKIIWNATNSSMDSTGAITADNAVLHDATITNGSIELSYTNSGIARKINITPQLQGIDFYQNNNIGARISSLTESSGGLMLSGKNKIHIGETNDILGNPIPTPYNRSSDLHMIVGAEGDAVFGSRDKNAYVSAHDDLKLCSENSGIELNAYNVELNATSGIILNADHISVPDNLSYISGYTGTKQLGNFDVRFINGICVSIVTH